MRFEYFLKGLIRMATSIPKGFKKWSNQFKLELIIAIIILILPFIIYTHLAFSKSSSEFALGSIGWEHGYKNNQLFVWNLLSDLLPLCLLIIAYSTINRSYRYFILPLVILFFCFTLSDLYCLDTMHYVFNIEGIVIAIFIIAILKQIDKYFIDELRAKSLPFGYNEFIEELVALRNTKIIKKVELTARRSKDVTSMQYVCRLHYYSELMQKAINKSIINSKEGQSKSKIFPNKVVFQTTIIIALVLNFLYLIFPEDIKSIELIGMYFHDLGFGSMHDLAWYLFKKLSLLLVFTIWFITTNYWWRIAIFSPILIYAYQIVEVFYGIKEIESYGNAKVFPAVFLISIFILLISRTIKLRTKMMDYIDLFQSEMNREIGKLSKSF